MCGIFGAFTADPTARIDRRVVDAMADTLFHRGPDGGGAYFDGPVALGMRRLSIIDLKTGDQPIANEDETVWVVFNGEIYNYRELRAQLLARGHRLKTASDTEVLVHLYEEHGADCISHLRGMFSFAIWDAPRRSLLLARDRLGIKPLYYAETPQGLAFASELKALIRSPWIERRADPDAVTAYLEYGYVPDPLSILKSVSKLPPGHTLLVRGGRPAELRQYWNPASFFQHPCENLSEAEAGSRLWDLLSDAVRSHLVSDVPLGAFLSGGVDSTTVLAIMARELGTPVRTFSIGFREPRFNELPYAREVAEWLETEHHELVVEPQDLGVLGHVLSGFDEPFWDSSALPTYVVSRLARAHVTVALSGDGGDELFAGYDRYLVDHRRRFIGLAGDTGLARPLRGISAILPEGTPGKNYLYHLSLPRMDRYLDSISVFPARTLGNLLGRQLQPETRFRSILEASSGLDALSRLQHLDLCTYLPGDVLTKLDRMSMANSLEARVPLLDHPLVEFACRLPARLRLRSGESKYLLKRVLKGRVPERVLARPKQGFAVPLEVWFSAPLSTYYRDVLGSGRRLGEVGIRPAAITRLLDLYDRDHRPDHCQQLWALLALDRSLAGLTTVNGR